MFEKASKSLSPFRASLQGDNQELFRQGSEDSKEQPRRKSSKQIAVDTSAGKKTDVGVAMTPLIKN